MDFDDGVFGGAEGGLSMPLGDFMAFLESEPAADDDDLSMPFGGFMAFVESQPAARAYKRKKHSTPPGLIPSDDDDFILPRRFKHKNTHKAKAVKGTRGGIPLLQDPFLSDDDDFLQRRFKHKNTQKAKAVKGTRGRGIPLLQDPFLSDDDDFLPRRFKHKNTQKAKAVKAKKVSKKSPTIPAKNEKKKHSPTISCHLSPSRQPSQTVETLDTAAEMMEEANLDVRHNTNATILPGKNQAQPPSLPPTVDSSRDDLDNRASVHGGSCGAHGDAHTRQGSVIITTNAIRTHHLSLEEECRIAPDGLGQQLRSNGPSSVPHAAQTTEGTQVALDTMVRNRGSPLTTEKGDRSAEKARVQRAGVEISFLNCRICFRPLKPPVFQCNGGHLACGTCLAELPGGQCPMCKHGGGFVPSLAVDDIVSSAMIKCSHNGCQSYVTYHELEDHHRACPHAPCFCTEPGCGFAGRPLALLGHLAALHSWPVHKVEYGKVLGLQVPVSEPRRLLLAKEDGRGFLLVVGELSAIIAVSVVCIRAGASLLPQYSAVMRAYGPPAVAGIRCMVDTKGVTSSSRPRDVTVEKLPFVLLVPPTHVFEAGASKEVSLKIRINKM